jgi:hypothetical protein
MATRFTPITSGAPQGGGEIDNLISAIQSIRQMRKQMKEDEWQKYLREYKLKQDKQADADRAESDSINSTVDMLNKTPHTSDLVKPLFGKINSSIYNSLMESSTDVVESNKQKDASTLGLLKEIEGNPWMATSDLMSKASEVGADTDRLLKLQQNIQSDLRQQQMLNKTTNPEPKPKPEPKPRPEPDLLQSQGVAVNTLDKMKTTGLVIDGVNVKAKPGGTKKSFETPAVEIKDADGYTWQQTNTGTYVWLDGKWKKAEKDGKKYKSTKGRNLTLSETYSKIIDKGYEELQKAMIEGKGKKAMNSGNIVGDIIGDY